MPPFFLVFSIRVMLALCSELGTFSFQVCFFYFSRIGVNFLKTWKNFLVKTFGPRIWKFLVNDLMFFIYFIWIFRVFVLFIHVGMSMKFRKQLMGFFFFFFYYIGSGDQTWVLSHGNWYLYLLSHLACSDFQIFDLVYIIVWMWNLLHGLCICVLVTLFLEL